MSHHSIRSLRTSPLLGWSVIVLVAVVLTGVAEAERSTSTGEQTLSGEWVWGAGDRGDLKAVFTPDGAASWQVSFHFEFRGAPHVYRGTAAGALDAGELSGRVHDEEKKREWVFSGRFEDGVFRGDHAEIFGERSSPTGTLSLRR